MKTTSTHIEQTSWSKARKIIKRANPELVSIIDQISPDDDRYPLYTVKYKYGSILDNEKGEFVYPVGDQLVPINDPALPTSFKNEFLYAKNSTPAGMLLSGAMELFFEDLNARIIPWRIFSPGDVFGMWSHMESGKHYHPTPVMKLSAGARSIFMLPNIGDYTLHRNLKRDFNIKVPQAKTLTDQWQVFKSLMDSHQASCTWEAKLLLFSENWLTSIKSDPAWKSLYMYFLGKVFNQSGFERNQIFYDHAFSQVQAVGNLRPNPYLADTFKHLIAIGVGAFPGFKVATDESMAPIKQLQQIYVDHYGLTKYYPTLLHPTKYDFSHNDFPIYYSLQFPTTIVSSPKSRKISSTLHDLRELKNITQTYTQKVLSGGFGIENTVVGDLLNNVALEFIHSKTDAYGEITHANSLSDMDPSFNGSLATTKAETQFCDSGTFIRGCVGFFHKKT